MKHVRNVFAVVLLTLACLVCGGCGAEAVPTGDDSGYMIY